MTQFATGVMALQVVMLTFGINFLFFLEKAELEQDTSKIHTCFEEIKPVAFHSLSGLVWCTL